MKSHPIVFIHGMFMTPLCWERWTERFQGLGYACHAPAWPGRDRPVAELRARHPDPELGRLGLRQVIDHLASFAGALPSRPIVVGHSMGGLVAQVLLHRGLAEAAVAIDSAPPPGVFTTRWSFLRSNLPMIQPFASGPRLPPFAWFQYAFVHTLPLDQQRAAYDRYVVPESRRVPRESLGPAARIDFRPPAPLLLVAGADDQIIPASLNRTNHARYRGASVPVDLVEFPGRTHFIIGQAGWEEVANRVASWLGARGL